MKDNNPQQKNLHPKQKTSHKKRWIIGIVIAVLLCGGAVGGWYVYQMNTRADKGESSSADREAVADNARKLIEKKDYDGAVNLVTSQKNYKDDPNLAAAYADALASKGEVDKAVAVFAELEKNGDRPYYYRAQAARVLASAGRKAEAITYYEQAIKLAQTVSTSDNEEETFTINDAIGDYQWYMEEIKSKESE